MQVDAHLVYSEDVIFSASEGRLRPGGEEEEVVQADTVMYSSNILVTLVSSAKEEEMLKVLCLCFANSLSVLPFLFLFYFFSFWFSLLT